MIRPYLNYKAIYDMRFQDTRKWEASYLQSKKQFVQANLDEQNFKSDYKFVSRGLPQVGATGPFLFNIYIINYLLCIN